MTTNPGRGKRRRGRRGQRPRQDTPEQVQQAEARPDAEPVAPPDQEARAAPRRESDGGDGGRKRQRPRRRTTARRQAIGPMPTEVLKPAVRNIRPSGPLARRTLDAFSTPDGMTFGCPMLSRTRIGMPFANGRPAPRCSMGWALHDEDEALLCMRTPNLLECWKAHPEREAELRASEEAENAAD